MYIVFVPGRVRKRAIRRDDKWRDLSGGVKKRGRSGLESEKTNVYQFKKKILSNKFSVNSLFLLINKFTYQKSTSHK